MQTERARHSAVEDTEPAAGPEAVISTVLRWGVVASAAIILLGVALYVMQAGPQAILFAPRGIPPGADRDPASLRAVLREVSPPQPAAIADLGLLLLIVTPVLSVAVLTVAFAVERDWMYVGFAVFVLAMLMVGFALGQA
jgi:uncharacterized membrane protein